jgi:DNA-binding FadR family transcriptional regulator
MRRGKYFDWEQAFHFIWHNADGDGIWHGNDESLAEEFEVSDESADEVLRELQTRRLVERLSARIYFLSNWRERDRIGLSDQ